MILHRRLPPWVLWIVFAACVALAVGGLVSAAKIDAELKVYTLAGARMAAGVEIYRPDEHKPFTYPPFSAMPFVPFSWLPPGEAMHVDFIGLHGDFAAGWVHRVPWYFINVGSLLICVLVLRRVTGPIVGRGRIAPWVFWVVTWLVASRHVAAVFQNQSNDLLVFVAVMLGLDWVWSHKQFRSGAWLGLGAAFKATPLLFLPVCLGQFRFRAAVGLVAALGMATLLPNLVFPRTDGGLWVVAWIEHFVAGQGVGRPAAADGAWNAWNILNQNLAGSIYRLSTPVPDTGEYQFDVAIWAPEPGLLRGVTLLAQLAVLAGIGWAAWPGRSRTMAEDERRYRRVGESAAVVCGMVLLSPMSSKSHFCVLLLPIAFCVADWIYVRRSPVVAACVVASLGFGLLTSKGVTRFFFDDFIRAGNEMLARGSVTACAVVLLIGTVVILRRRALLGAGVNVTIR